MLEVAFVRRRGARDRVYVRRGDGTSLDWSFPSYGDGLPHDLCHLVVEDGLGLTDGFWGLIDQGVGVGLVNNEATLMRDGRPLVTHDEVDFSGLTQAEAAVAILAGPVVTQTAGGDAAIAGTSFVGDGSTTLPATATPQSIATISAQLSDLARRWRSLDDGGAIDLVFEPRKSQVSDVWGSFSAQT